ncbi:NADPH:adrenodoxin oxidoreductase, mitochondrial [Cimex lectularius]|uniref:NADPH:adrenodoxin oxidoreductase, mitochondrial n=1 Tax=Cimex lectularius TaxID=79782 RepID=A0A8I6RM91_CIMLE|nr:NADPH:adrenodoxin oxidoreductase, mitochondrial [Cimex lectularius]
MWKLKLFPGFFRGLAGKSEPPRRVCIVGSGPAGFYFAQHLFKGLPSVVVDMYEKLPVPFGLVRYGVAPDHPEVKNVINTFTKVASNPNFQFIGNTSVGKDIRFDDLTSAYHAVVLAYGCSEDLELGVKGENLENVISARRFVGWYNGLPEDKDLTVDFSSEDVVIIGQGNVAIDTARILLTPVDLLKKTDITSYALDALCKSCVKRVHLVGRRGPLQVAFTIKEFREMTKLPNVQTLFRNEQFDIDEDLINDLQRPRKRLTELMMKTVSTDQNGDKTFSPLFLRRPEEFLGDERVEGVKFVINTIDNKTGIVTPTDNFENVECGMVLRSIGYKGICPDDAIPFDRKTGQAINSLGVYTSGWIGTGPTGVIISTMNNAFSQADALIQDIQSGKLDTSEAKPGYNFIKTILDANDVVTVSFEGWQRIDKVEVERGAKEGKPREKIVDIDELVEIGGEKS